MRRREFIASFALGLSLIAVSACGKQEQTADKTAAGKVIEVAVTPASPPNLFEENGKTQGLDYDLFDANCPTGKG